MWYVWRRSQGLPSGASLPRRFFRSEYSLDYQLSVLSKPTVALLDGIVMGGGAGVSINGVFRVATERCAELGSPLRSLPWPHSLAKCEAIGQPIKQSEKNDRGAVQETGTLAIAPA